MTSAKPSRTTRTQIANRLLEIYRSKQYRTTTSGRKVRWDEPGEDDTPEVRQHNAILDRQRKRKTAAQNRLKSKGIIPSKDGEAMFEELLQLDEDLYKVLNTFRSLYQTNRTMNFRTWAQVVAKVLEDLD